MSLGRCRDSPQGGLGSSARFQLERSPQCSGEEPESLQERVSGLEHRQVCAPCPTPRSLGEAPGLGSAPGHGLSPAAPPAPGMPSLPGMPPARPGPAPHGPAPPRPARLPHRRVPGLGLLPAVRYRGRHCITAATAAAPGPSARSLHPRPAPFICAPHPSSAPRIPHPASFIPHPSLRTPHPSLHPSPRLRGGRGLLGRAPWPVPRARAALRRR